ncbi:hypothetical protein DSM3645_25587 [Blastopirellula marina DSM 3645]|uniref:Uncharacterized protein n=1 Tax=Blastopirellula marina DSM 3645 TaxID=314230 RepID=A4A0I5_9BACT|nr:hypothetical protein DSM3645_25587 [Blastopirellula marina DSM 3645]
MKRLRSNIAKPMCALGDRFRRERTIVPQANRRSGVMRFQQWREAAGGNDSNLVENQPVRH